MVTAHHGLWMCRAEEQGQPQDSSGLATGNSLPSRLWLTQWLPIPCRHYLESVTLASSRTSPNDNPPEPHSYSVESEMDTAFVSFTNSTTIALQWAAWGRYTMLLRVSSEGDTFSLTLRLLKTFAV